MSYQEVGEEFEASRLLLCQSFPYMSGNVMRTAVTVPGEAVLNDLRETLDTRRPGHVLRTYDPPETSAPANLQGQVWWGGDLVLHLHDDAQVAGQELAIEVLLTGRTVHGREIRETVRLDSLAGGWSADTYYRTRFAYGYVHSIKILRISPEPFGSPAVWTAANDYFRIGLRIENLTGATENTRRIGIPWQCRDLRDITAIKCDRAPSGGGTAAPNGTLARNARGIYDVDLIQGNGGGKPRFDPEDNAIIHNGFTELSRATLYQAAAGASWALKASPTAGDFFLVFQYDPLVPSVLGRDTGALFHTNIR